MASKNYQETRLKDLIIDHLGRSAKPMGPSELAKVVESTPNSVSQALRELLLEQKITKKGRGNYVLVGDVPAPERSGEVRKAGVRRRNGSAPEETNVMSYPYLEGGPGAGASGVQWDEGEMITVPTSVAAAWANGRRVEESGAYWTRVQGSSMEPWLPDQAPVFVERTSEVVGGGRYVLWLDDVDAEVIKRIERLGGGYLRIISDNPAHATQLLRHVQDDVYEDEATQAKVRVRIRGRVLYPPDTPHAILKTVTEQMARMVGRSDGGLQAANH